jgi:hypothetical protein
MIICYFSIIVKIFLLIFVDPFFRTKQVAKRAIFNIYQALPRIGTNLTSAAVVGSKIIIYGGFTGDGSIANAVSFDTRMYYTIIVLI